MKVPAAVATISLSTLAVFGLKTCRHTPWNAVGDTTDGFVSRTTKIVDSTLDDLGPTRASGNRTNTADPAKGRRSSTKSRTTSSRSSGRPSGSDASKPRPDLSSSSAGKPPLQSSGAKVPDWFDDMGLPYEALPLSEAIVELFQQTKHTTESSLGAFKPVDGHAEQEVDSAYAKTRRGLLSISPAAWTRLSELLPRDPYQYAKLETYLDASNHVGPHLAEHALRISGSTDEALSRLTKLSNWSDAKGTKLLSEVTTILQRLKEEGRLREVLRADDWGDGLSVEEARAVKMVRDQSKRRIKKSGRVSVVNCAPIDKASFESVYGSAPSAKEIDIVARYTAELSKLPGGPPTFATGPKDLVTKISDAGGDVVLVLAHSESRSEGRRLPLANGKTGILEGIRQRALAEGKRVVFVTCFSSDLGLTRKIQAVEAAQSVRATLDALGEGHHEVDDVISELCNQLARRKMESRIVQATKLTVSGGILVSVELYVKHRESSTPDAGQDVDATKPGTDGDSETGRDQ